MDNDDLTEKISIYLLKNGSYDDDFDFLKKWIKQVEKERGWRL